jgi:S1-C subfamily serine protease
VFLWGFIGGTWNLLQTEQNILSDNHLQRAADQPADRAGVLSQDVILAVDDIAVDRVGEVMRVIKGTEIGNEVTLTIFRSGETFVVPVKLGKKPIAQDDPEE